MGRVTVAFVVVVLLVGVAGVGATAAGYGPMAALTDDIRGMASDGGGTPTPGSGGGTNAASGGGSNGGSGGGGSSATPTEPEPFGVTIVDVSECGDTCRDVTVRVTNRLNETTEGVGITSKIYAGKRSDDGDKLWEGSKDLGTIAGGSSTTVTSRVELGLMDAATVKNNDGWITVRTTVTSGDVTAEFVEEKQVA